MLMGEFAYLKN